MWVSAQFNSEVQTPRKIIQRDEMFASATDSFSIHARKTALMFLVVGMDSYNAKRIPKKRDSFVVAKATEIGIVISAVVRRLSRDTVPVVMF